MLKRRQTHIPMQPRTPSYPPSYRLWLLIAAGCLGLMALLSALAPAPAAAMPPRPPRPTAPPTTPPSPTPTPQRTLIVLVYTLRPEALPAAWQTLWTGVQWQDRLGAWHDVEGWQGTLDEEVRGIGKKTWVVADGHLGQGPFRWQIYARRGGDVIAASRPFYLPSAAGDVYEVRAGAWEE